MKIRFLFMLLCAMVLFCSCANRPAQEAQSPAGNSQTTAASATSRISQSAQSGSAAADSPPLMTDYAPETWSAPHDELPETWDDIRKYPPVKRDIAGINAATIRIEGAYQDVFPIVTNDTALEQLVSPLDLYKMTAITENCERFAVLRDYHIKDRVDSVPIGFLRRVEDGMYYSVNKLYDGGYAYLFFEREKNADTQEYVTDDLTDVYLSGCIYMEKSLSKKDFANIAAGDSIDKVIAIDNAASIQKLNARWYQSIAHAGMENCMTKHLLEDGLLVIYYKNEGWDLIVKDIDFNEDFVFANQYDDSVRHYTKTYKILPQDYPPKAPR